MKYYFIPSWYPEQRTWYDNTNSWYNMWSTARFDDTINQLRMFEAAGEDNQLLLLNYMPNLRYYKHRYDLFEVDTWSVFDQLQGIGRFQGPVVDYLDFDWPEGIEFVNSPFLVMAFLKNERYAQVEFGDSGQVIWVDFFEKEQLKKRLVFDDRGFVSSICYYQDGQAQYQDYLGLNGEWRLREWFGEADGHVEVNPNLRIPIAEKQRYEKMEDLVQERLNVYLKTNSEPAAIFLTASPQHHDLVMRARGNQKIVLSFFDQRYPLNQPFQLVSLLSAVDLVITDSKKTADLLAGFQLAPVQHQSLFDTRLALGKSQRLQELYIYFLIDGLAEGVLVEYLDQVFRAMEGSKDIHLSLVSYQTQQQGIRETKEWVEELLDSRPESYLYLVKEDNRMFEFGDQEEMESRVSLSFFHSENEIINSLDTIRLIVDLREEPDLYTQIAGISSGIPQINRVETEFVEHLKNGWILSDTANLGEAISYYLTGLTNWNKSLIHSVQKISDYTSGVLVEKVKEKIR